MIRNRIAFAALSAAMSGCATVATDVTLLDPSAALPPPKENVRILLERPAGAYEEIALIEARGIAGQGEKELLEAARREAAKLGADAVIRLSVDAMTVPPVQVYDPWPVPFYPRYYWLRHGPFFGPSYYGHYRLVGGGTELKLNALAIQFPPGAVPEARTTPGAAR